MLNVSGNPELTEYYENYPGMYELQSETWDGLPMYKQITGVDEAGNNVYGEGIVRNNSLVAFSIPSNFYRIITKIFN